MISADWCICIGYQRFDDVIPRWSALPARCVVAWEASDAKAQWTPVHHPSDHLRLNSERTNPPISGWKFEPNNFHVLLNNQTPKSCNSHAPYQALSHTMIMAACFTSFCSATRVRNSTQHTPATITFCCFDRSHVVIQCLGLNSGVQEECIFQIYNDTGFWLCGPLRLCTLPHR